MVPSFCLPVLLPAARSSSPMPAASSADVFIYVDEAPRHLRAQLLDRLDPLAHARIFCTRALVRERLERAQVERLCGIRRKDEVLASAVLFLPRIVRALLATELLMQPRCHHGVHPFTGR
uniref:Uncharacterized protein n=1 Tax=Diacronema lutheri TaxID=2081491 RepID=A0A7R9UMP2_DIALT